MRDFIAALKTRKASCGRAYIRENVHVAWDKVGGLDNVKAEIEKDVIWPNRYRQLAIQLGVKPPAGIILYGPPGTGKSYLARAISTRLQWPIIWKRGAELRSKYLGETQKNLEALFNAAMINAPSTLLVEEFDSLGSKRMAGGDAAQREIDNAVNTIIESIDRIIEAQSQVLLIFTTNRIDMLDDALLRSGRVDGHYYIGPPDEAGRESIFLIYAKNYQTGDIDYKELAKNTEGFTPADIKRVWEEASRICFASSILKHESLSKATSFNGLEDGSPKRTSVPETSIETDPVTMRDLTTVIEKLRSQNLKRRM